MIAMVWCTVGLFAAGCAGSGMGAPENMVDASNEPECARLDTLFHWMTQYVFVTESDKQACQQAVELVAKQTNERIIQHQLQFQQQMGATPEQQRMMEQILRQQPVGEAIKNGRVCGGGCKGTCN